MKKFLTFLLVLVLAMFSLSCRKGAEEAQPEKDQAVKAQPERTEPERVRVQHILISFQGSIPKPEVTRTQAEAEELARMLFDRAKKGEDFDALVKEYTDDAYPGIYAMSNLDVTPDEAANEFPRAGMVKAFGDVSFSLNAGEIGMTEFDPTTSKYGWHIIKRLE
jgi:NIMA-interacting peptidyl-prolyl cis-trans isomerase 1